MEITVKESKVVKAGRSDKGPWELILVISDDNTEYTTFDKKAKQPTGSVIGFEPIVKEGKLSFKECFVISEASVAEKPQDQMSKAEWADKDRIERASIEAQTAFKGIIELMVAKVALHDVGSAALNWALSRLAPPMTYKQTPQADTEKAEKDVKELWEEPEAEVPRTAELFAWLVEKMNWKNAEFARTWIRNDFKNITEKMIDEEPVKVQTIIAKEKGWTV